MSDLNDDLLNYELGEELDDQSLVADEDELLLSDEELEKEISSEQKAKLKNDAEKWVCSKLKLKKSTSKDDTRKTENIVTTSSTESEVLPDRSNNIKNNDIQAESDVSTSEETPHKIQIQEKISCEKSENDSQNKNDEVTSTNKEIEDQSVSQTDSDKLESVDNLKKGEIKENEETIILKENESKNVLDAKDLEDQNKRTNIKQTTERDEQSDSAEKHQSGRFFSNKRGRGGTMRNLHFPGSRATVKYPHIQYPPQYAQHSNENAHPPQYSYQPPDSQVGIRQPFGIPNQIPRMDFRSPVSPNFRPQNPEYMYRGPRPEFPSQINGAPYYCPPVQVRPVYRQDGNVPLTLQGQMRHRMPIPPRPAGIPTQNQAQTYPATISQPHVIPNTTHAGNFAVLTNVQTLGQSNTQPIIPRKVLINPNFKGGVEAATNQFMKDTQLLQTVSGHSMHLQNDDELLRQQEEFIKKNRMHIEKRRYERSPERNRSRERSYSPIRRDKRGGSRERRGGSPRGRTRRASSKETESSFSKRRRSGSYERRREKEKLEEEEDEETRAYRQEIEKQKAMREKILRDKEMRRRKAAEGKQTEEKPQTATDESPQKLKPIIVTESKIISLKKKTSDSVTQSQPVISVKTKSAQLQCNSETQQQQVIQKTIPTAKILPETKKSKIVQKNNVKDASIGTLNTAIIKPVVKKTISIQADVEDDDSIDEDLLLAETPSPPSSPPYVKSKLPLTKTSNDRITSNNSSSNNLAFSNRRVVLKSVKDDEDPNSESNRKPIFGRLEKKIAVNESVKRKIQRIVIKNTE